VTTDVVIIGGGAAGLMCAIQSGKRRRRAVLIEHNDRVGIKIGISGGGRCNFTNIHTRPENFISRNPHFAKSALARYTPADFIRLVDRHGIAWHEKKLGQLFCDGTSQQIITMLLRECDDAGVRILETCNVTGIRKREHFEIETNRGNFESRSLVVATGGLSIPKIGATDFGYRTARDFGLKIIETRPALVPLRLSGEEGRTLATLSGVSLDAIVKCRDMSFRENILFTHRGLSGPAILQISSYWRPGEFIHIDAAPDDNLQKLPKRFLQLWREAYGKDPSLLHEWKVAPAGSEGYAKAEVTAGGVDTAELSSQTMESRRVPGLYFTGEVVDVTGHLGGFNFQWAWASGFVAGSYV
jgi:predicted Rossmann fold flavoprotein